jgi:hypothetical protein
MDKVDDVFMVYALSKDDLRACLRLLGLGGLLERGLCVETSSDMVDSDFVNELSKDALRCFRPAGELLEEDEE